MRKENLIIVMVLVSLNTFGQSSRDSIRYFFESLFDQLENGYVHRDQVDWEKLKPVVMEQAFNSGSFRNSLEVCPMLFDRIGGDHLNLFSEYGWFHSNLGVNLGPDDFHEEFVRKYSSNPDFEARLLDGRYGYILMPAMLLLDATQDSLNRIAQEMYDQVVEIAKNSEVRGWIVDLRFNVGGNIFPMLAGLYHLLGDHTMYTVIDKEGSILEIDRMEGGAVFEQEKIQTSIAPSIEPDEVVPVALITGPASGSCGELIPVSFRGRPNVVVIGEETPGFLTANSMTKLPYEIKLTLTTGYLADRKAVYTPNIVPDKWIEKQANFNDLTKDENVQAAIEFFQFLDRAKAR